MLRQQITRTKFGRTTFGSTEIAPVTKLRMISSLLLQLMAVFAAVIRSISLSISSSYNATITRGPQTA